MNQPERTPMEWIAIAWRFMCSWGFSIGSKAVTWFLLFGLMSLGARLSYPELGQRLSKFIPWLDDYELTYKWDLANLAAILVLFTSYFFTMLSLRFYLSKELIESLEEWGWPIEFVRRFVITIAVVIITVDCCIFYKAFNAAVWGQATFSPGVLIATLGYLTALMGTVFVTIYLDQRVSHLLKKGQRPCEPSRSSPSSSSSQDAASVARRPVTSSNRSPAITSSTSP